MRPACRRGSPGQRLARRARIAPERRGGPERAGEVEHADQDQDRLDAVVLGLAVGWFVKDQARADRAMGRRASPMSAITQKTAPVWNVEDAPRRSHRSPAKALATSMATPLIKLKNP